MNQLFEEMGRAARMIPLEIRARWHGYRAVRHHDLRKRHKAEFDRCISEARTLAAR